MEDENAKSYDDMYFVSVLFAYGAELDTIKQCESKKEFCFSNTVLDEIYVLNGNIPLTVKEVLLEDAYGYYQKRKLMCPPNFPDGRRRFLELLHADKF